LKERRHRVHRLAGALRHGRVFEIAARRAEAVLGMKRWRGQAGYANEVGVFLQQRNGTVDRKSVLRQHSTHGPSLHASPPQTPHRHVVHPHKHTLLGQRLAARVGPRC
jgi:hypothetical protein